ncbi:MAG TPA: saccharopine dehydrogenase C-terminal domain-containing protein [Stellaceae bacterium]|nr:saccharopine dehydrogenase C-terminal domain-containing protein [Stellaceae bacterium]
MLDIKHAVLRGRLVIVGFGSIGQGVLPLLLRHLEMDPKQITIVTADPRGREVAAEYGVAFDEIPLTRANYRAMLDPRIGRGDFLLNLSVDVSSTALIELCQEKGALYLDTCIEPWPGGYTDPSLPPSARSNYALRESALTLCRQYPRGSTAVVTHGANPGLVSHFVKQALVDLAREADIDAAIPRDRIDWARLAQRLGVKAIHIAERDTQVSNIPKEPGEFVNTWSIEGFVSEGSQPAELGWGTHERHFPADGRRHHFGSAAAIYLLRPGAATRVRSWTPLEGPYLGFLITHGEAISIADFLTIREGDEARYRPTCHYAYHPCDDAVLSLHEFAGKNWRLQAAKRLMMDEITKGTDELGVLLMGSPKGVYWYGSRLTIDEARRAAPHNNATSLQVTAAVLGGVIWALEHPQEGIVEPEGMDFRRVLEVARPYLGEVVGVHGSWTPLDGRESLFPEDLDRNDPWQFKNIRVV